MTLRERFEQYVYPDPNSGCYLWGGASDPNGYGLFHVGSNKDGSSHCAYAHRVAWELEHGESPGASKVLHKCDFPPCVNPDHLFMGTMADNQRDMATKGRGSRSRKGMPFGVTQQGRRYYVQIKVRGVRRALGGYGSLEEAAAIALAAKAAIAREVR